MTEDTRSTRKKAGKRTLGRELALKALYQLDLLRLGPEATFDDLVREQAGEPDTVTFAREIFDGVRASQADVDRAISASAKNWELGRMAVVDRNVIRIAAYEMLRRKAPPKVAINEAVELAKKFSSAASGAFVNGVLDEIRRTLPAGEAPAGPDAGTPPTEERA